MSPIVSHIQNQTQSTKVLQVENSLWVRLNVSCRPSKCAAKAFRGLLYSRGGFCDQSIFASSPEAANGSCGSLDMACHTSASISVGSLYRDKANDPHLYATVGGKKGCRVFNLYDTPPEQNETINSEAPYPEGLTVELRSAIYIHYSL